MTPLVIGHRGFPERYPENSLLSFQSVIDAGAQAIELDVQMSGGHPPVPIVLHDATLEATTHGKGYANALPVEQLKKLELKARGSRASEGPTQTLSTLEDVLAHFAGKGITIFIEIKDPNAAGVVAAMVGDAAQEKKSGSPLWEPHQLPIISFDESTLRAVRHANASAALGVSGDPLTSSHLALAKELGAHCVIPNIKKLDQDRVEQAHRQGLRVYCWTCNAVADIDKAIRLGVDGIMGDNPATIQSQITARHD